MWTYVLMSMILSIVLSRSSQRRNDEDANDPPESDPKKLAFAAIAPLFSVVYGTAVIHMSHVCSDMKKTGLWVIAQMIYYSSVIAVVFIIILLLIHTLIPPVAQPSGEALDFEEISVQLSRLQSVLNAASSLPQAEAVSVPVVSDVVVATDVSVDATSDQISVAQATAV